MSDPEAPPFEPRALRITLQIPPDVAERLRERARLEHRDPRREAEHLLSLALAERDAAPIERAVLDRGPARYWPAIDSENPSLERDPWP